MAVTADQKFVVSGSSDNTIKIWNLETGQEIRTLNGHKNYVRSVAVTADQKFVVSGSSDKTVKIWNLETGLEIHSFSAINFINQQVTLADNQIYEIFASPNSS